MTETPEDKLIRHLRRSSFDVLHSSLNEAHSKNAWANGDNFLTSQEVINIVTGHHWTYDEYQTEVERIYASTFTRLKQMKNERNTRR